MAVDVRLGSWEDLGSDAGALRRAVFVVEQGVPEELEMDAYDAVSLHAVAYGSDGQVLGTGRLLPDGHIGRMAVAQAARGQGVGGQVLDALVLAGHQSGVPLLALNAQVHAQAFYAGRGFAAEGDVFDDAGIAHVVMTKTL